MPCTLLTPFLNYVSNCTQFNVERFVDGLLGIGSAGGSKNKNEGKMLAQRLDVMRKERDARSKTRSSTPAKPSAAKVPAMAGPPPAEMEMESDFSFDDSGVVELTGEGGEALTTSGVGAGGRGGNPRRSKNKKKKRKNRK